MASTWVTDYAGLREFLEHNMILDSTMKAYASQAARYAQGIAPVGSPADDDEHIGAYRASLGAVKNPDGPGWRVQSTDNKAHWIEYGAQHMPRYSVLTRAVGTISGNDWAGFG